MTHAENWCLRRRATPAALAALVSQVGDPLLARVLYARKHEQPAEVSAFLSAEGRLADPWLMAGMREAVERLCQALSAREQIIVYGDFDADGVCATSLLVSVLQQLGGQVAPYIPDRFDEGYGLNDGALERLRDQGAQVLVTVDCGVRSSHEVAAAQQQGLDVIVTDHHSIGQALPPALAVINPKQPTCPYPFKDLSGVGLAYRLAEALVAELRSRGHAVAGALDLVVYLDLVALGTVADVVPLQGENRLLVQWGLNRLRTDPRPGVLALLETAKLAKEQVNSLHLAFRLAPRINAAGRLKGAMLAFDLLSAQDVAQAQRLATELNTLNIERQRLLDEQVLQAQQMLGDTDGQSLLFVEGPAFHEGIVGLVASRLTDQYYRPSLVMRRGEQTTRGSARSIEGFNIIQALDACADLLQHHGGHARAAGFTLVNENLSALRERLQAHASDPQHLLPAALQRKRLVDAIVELDELTPQTPDVLARMEPYGEGNPEPALASLGLQVLDFRTVGQENKHLRLNLGNGRCSLPAIAFRLGHRASELKRGDLVDVLYCPTRNEWQGQVSLQLDVSALRHSNAGREGG